MFAISFAIFFAIKAIYGLRVKPEEERYGLDMAEHGMWGYPGAVHAGARLRVPPAGPAGRPPAPRPAPVGLGTAEGGP